MVHRSVVEECIINPFELKTFHVLRMVFLGAIYVMQMQRNENKKISEEKPAGPDKKYQKLKNHVVVLEKTLGVEAAPVEGP